MFDLTAVRPVALNRTGQNETSLCDTRQHIGVPLFDLAMLTMPFLQILGSSTSGRVVHGSQLISVVDKIDYDVTASRMRELAILGSFYYVRRESHHLAFFLPENCTFTQHPFPGVKDLCAHFLAFRRAPRSSELLNPIT